jgi:para-aminobenzoate synthetase component 1
MNLSEWSRNLPIFPLVLEPAVLSCLNGISPMAAAAVCAEKPACVFFDDAQARRFVLENRGQKDDEGRWSRIAFSPLGFLQCKNGIVNWRISEQPAVILEARPLAVLTALFPKNNQNQMLAQKARRRLPFGGGWAVCFSYDLGRDIERLPTKAVDDLDFPQICMGYYDMVFAYEHQFNQWWGFGLLGDDSMNARERLRLRMLNAAEELAAAAKKSALVQAENDRRERLEITSNFSFGDYRKALCRILEYIAAGDCCQVNLAQRFQAHWGRTAWRFFDALRTQSPARYGVYWNFSPFLPGKAAAGVSPELFLKVRGRDIVTRPIKGTRPRGRNDDEDLRQAASLKTSPKDAAELAMIVDLERNDLGRICEYGSVRVVSPGELEELPTVFHRTAEVAGRLRADCRIPDILRATFPGGSVTGAPKIRAMEIIEELEPTQRGPYCGAIGWISPTGDLELNLAIRTALVDQNKGVAYYHAGGGIVADSDPDSEYQETLHKAKAFFNAVEGSISF